MTLSMTNSIIPMQYITTIQQPFTSEEIHSSELVGHHTYRAVKKGSKGNYLRTDYMTVIGGHSIKLTLSTLEAEEGDVCLCAEVSFEVDGAYDRVVKGIKVRATKWLLTVWKAVLTDSGYGEFYCDPHDTDGYVQYRRDLFAKLGFEEDHGMLVLKLK